MRLSGALVLVVLLLDGAVLRWRCHGVELLDEDELGWMNGLTCLGVVMVFQWCGVGVD